VTSLAGDNESVFRVELNMQIKIGEDIGRVVRRTENCGVIVQLQDGTQMGLTAAQVSVGVMHPLPPTGRGDLHETLSAAWASASKAARKEAVAKQQHVFQVRTGFRKGFPPTPKSKPNPQFDPSLPWARRLQAKATQLEVSVQTIRNWVSAEAAGGAPALLDGRSNKRGPLASLDPKWVEKAREAIRAREGESKMSVRNIAEQLDRELRDSAIFLPPIDAAMEALEEIVGKDKDLHGSRARNRSNKAVGNGVHGLRMAAYPGHIVILDATPLNVRVYDPNTNTVGGCELILAIDLFSRAILGLTLVPTARSVDVGAVIWEVIKPYEGLPGELPYAGVPHALLIPSGRYAGVREQPQRDPTHKLERSPLGTGIVPDTLVVDHGSIFVSHHVFGMAQSLGITIEPANVRMPNQKGQVERSFGTLESFLERQPGYKGADVSGRGEDPDASACLTVREMENRIRAWVREVYHESWHEGITIPDASKTKWTPRRSLEVGMELWGTPVLPVDERLAIAFMPFFVRTIRPEGVDVNGFRYNAEAFNPYRNKPNPAGNTDDPFQYVMRVHPGDISTLYFEDPVTHDIHEVPWRYRDYVGRSFSMEQWRRAEAMFAGESEPPPKHEMLRLFFDRVHVHGYEGTAVERRVAQREDRFDDPIQSMLRESAQVLRDPAIYAEPDDAVEPVARDTELTALTYESDDDDADEPDAEFDADLDLMGLIDAEDA
jgi:transposase InsO family protein